MGRPEDAPLGVYATALIRFPSNEDALIVDGGLVGSHRPVPSKHACHDSRLERAVSVS